MIYRVISKEYPFYSTNEELLKEKHLKETPKAIQRKIPSKLEDIIEKCLKKDKDYRYDNFSEIIDDLLSISSHKPQFYEPAEELNAFYYGNKALSYVNAKEYDKAKEYFEIALKMDPFLSRAYNNRGIMYSELNQYEDAIADYNKAIEIDPLFVEAYGNRSGIYFELGDLPKATEDAIKSVKLDKRYYQGYANLAYCYFDSKNYDKALIACNSFLNLTKLNTEDILLLKAECYHYLGMYESSLDLFAEILKMTDSHKIGYLATLKKIKPLMMIDEESALDFALSFTAKFYNDETLNFLSDDCAIRFTKAFMEIGKYKTGITFLNTIYNEQEEVPSEVHDLFKECINAYLNEATNSI